MNDVETMLHLMLVEDAAKHGLVIDQVRVREQRGAHSLTVTFDDGHFGQIGTHSKKGSALEIFLELANSPRGRFQLWLVAKRRLEYAAALTSATAKLGRSAARFSDLGEAIDPEEWFTRKVGRTPGGRTYEVVDGPFGRKVSVIDEATFMVAQRGPFTKTVTRYYKLANPHGMNGNTVREKGWRRRAKFWVEPRTTCRFLEEFVSRSRKIRWLVDVDLSGTHDPAVCPIRARKLAKLACEISARQEFPPPADWEKDDKLTFPLEYGVFEAAWRLSYYDNSVMKASEMFAKIVALFASDDSRWPRLQERFREVV